MALRSIGRQVDWVTVRQLLGNRVTEQYGLMDRTGAGMATMFREYGLGAGNQGDMVTWDDVAARAGRQPVCLGGQGWYHWTFVRRLTSNGTLALGNPAPNWKGVGQDLDQHE